MPLATFMTLSLYAVRGRLSVRQRALAQREGVGIVLPEAAIEAVDQQGHGAELGFRAGDQVAGEAGKKVWT